MDFVEEEFMYMGIFDIFYNMHTNGYEIFIFIILTIK